MQVKLIAAIVGVVMALGAIGGTVVWAQGGIQGGTPVTTAANPCEVHRQALAQRLGISVDKLQQAQKDAAKDVIDQALKDGKITADQAAKAKQRIDAASGKCEFFGHLGGVGGEQHPLKAGLQVGFEAAAKALGMTTDELKAALKSGKSIEEIAKSKNVDLNSVKDAIVNAEKAHLDQAVKDGKITQAQADKMKSALDQHADQLLKAFKHHPRNQKTR